MKQERQRANKRGGWFVEGRDASTKRVSERGQEHAESRLEHSRIGLQIAPTEASPRVCALGRTIHTRRAGRAWHASNRG